MKDKCVVCKEETNYDFDEHIDVRVGYIDGCGQLCLECYGDVKTLNWDIVEKMVDDNPNDFELGGKVRHHINITKGGIG